MTSQQQTPEDAWTTVTRRRRPPHFLPSSCPPPTQTTPLSHPPLTYAQAVRTKPAMPPVNHSSAPKQPSPPGSPPSQHYVASPYSPTLLPHPPSPHLKEWWGKCFRCTRKGHIAAECKYPKVNHNLTDQPHKTTLINPTVQQAPQTQSQAQLSPTVQHTPPMPRRIRIEPTFEELIAEPEPNHDPIMPATRPRKVRCYFSRDDQYLQTLQKMLRGIVVHPPRRLAASLSLDQVATTIAASGKVTPTQLQVASLSHRRYLVLIPPTLQRDDVVAAIPKWVWDEGFTFHSYSPLTDASISIPLYKLWIDITGAPLELHSEVHMAHAISSFGLYLGSMEPRSYGDCNTWTVFLATDDLASVPHELEFKIGGLQYTATVHPRKWIGGQIYQRHDLPPTSIPFHPPSSPTPPIEPIHGTPHSGSWTLDDDLMPMSLTALREIFRDFSPSELPPDLADCLAGKKGRH